MALYLGNQKVSLRSGQDPTFDYGFDSNGRLVFANKNATEINNFLNYDSSYSEILDLSNLSKMEKVAVNGMADRKMEGLKGLLVSPNAPFTGSSPQINASYTGLNKSALVSLFESVPYNVGYEVVGNPTISNGVVSSFSGSDYLETSKTLSFSTQQKIEIATKITTGDTVSTSGIIGPRYGNSTFGIYLQGNKPSTMFYYNNGQQAKNNYNTSSVSLNTNTTYYLKAIYDIQNVTSTIMVSTDGINYISDTKTLEDFVSWYTWIDNNAYRIGITQSGTFAGLINLNETYIKVNDVYWFRGQPTMTKTLSCIGATGTADLTQEDKNTILNKGWSLTVQ